MNTKYDIFLILQPVESPTKQTSFIHSLVPGIRRIEWKMEKFRGRGYCLLLFYVNINFHVFPHIFLLFLIPFGK